MEALLVRQVMSRLALSPTLVRTLSSAAKKDTKGRWIQAVYAGEAKRNKCFDLFRAAYSSPPPTRACPADADPSTAIAAAVALLPPSPSSPLTASGGGGGEGALERVRELLEMAAAKKRGDAHVLLGLLASAEGDQRELYSRLQLASSDHTLTSAGHFAVGHFLLCDSLVAGDAIKRVAREKAAFHHFEAGSGELEQSMVARHTCLRYGRGVLRGAQEAALMLTLSQDGHEHDINTLIFLADQSRDGGGQGGDMVEEYVAQLEKKVEEGVELSASQREALAVLGVMRALAQGDTTLARKYTQVGDKGDGSEQQQLTSLSDLLVGVVEAAEKGKNWSGTAAAEVFRRQAAEGNALSSLYLATTLLQEGVKKEGNESEVAGLLSTLLHIPHPLWFSSAAPSILPRVDVGVVERAEAMSIGELCVAVAERVRRADALPLRDVVHDVLIAAAKGEGVGAAWREEVEPWPTTILEKKREDHSYSVEARRRNLEKAALKGDSTSSRRLFLQGIAYRRKGKKNTTEGHLPGNDSAVWLEMGLEKGHAWAQSEQGWKLVQSKNVEDHRKGMFLLLSTCEQYAPSLHRCGLALLEGKGARKDEVEALTYFEQAARRGYAPSMLKLYECLWGGVGGRDRRGEAVEWLELHALFSEGDREKYLLGMRYLRGNGVPKELVKGLTYVLKACIEGFPNAAYRMGILRQKGIDGVGRDLDVARLWFEQGHEQGDVRASVALGSCYLKGDGCEVDYAKAKELFEIGREKKVNTAMANLAIMHEHGYGMKSDKKKAHSLYLEAAHLGHPLAEYKVGLNYYFGNVKMDKKAGIGWIKKAAAKGHPPAKKMVDKVNATIR